MFVFVSLPSVIQLPLQLPTVFGFRLSEPFLIYLKQGDGELWTIMGGINELVCTYFKEVAFCFVWWMNDWLNIITIWIYFTRLKSISIPETIVKHTTAFYASDTAVWSLSHTSINAKSNNVWSFTSTPFHDTVIRHKINFATLYSEYCSLK